MTRDAALSPSPAYHHRYAPPYNPALASSASASSASVWSDTSSQASDDTSTSTLPSDTDSCDSYCLPPRKNVAATYVNPIALPAEQRKNPRRSGSSHTRADGPPKLTRQSDRKVNFVDNLVDSSTQIVEAIWPLSSVVCRTEAGSKTVLPLRTFIQETLRRSRTSYSTLQVALYYLILIKPHVPKHNFTMEQPEDRHADRALQCGRRMFLAALILASKYLQDRNYSARAWSKISGLNTHEINQNEIAFLIAVDWKLHIADEVFQRWTEVVLKYTPPPTPPSPGGASLIAAQIADWKQLILRLNVDLTNVELTREAERSPSPVSTPVSESKFNPCDLSVLSPRSILNMPDGQMQYSSESSEPVQGSPSLALNTNRLVPALGRLPTPRLPPSQGFCTPAASAASQMLGKTNAMGMAMNQVTSAFNVQCLDRLPCGPSNTSPQSYCPARRSSLANSVSSASSPESMVSDTSLSSRASSISAASHYASATLNSTLSLPSRSRGLKPCGDKFSGRPAFTPVPEDHDVELLSSPDSYSGPFGKTDACMDTPLARRENALNMAVDVDCIAARTLQSLHSQGSTSSLTTPTLKSGAKRSRPQSIDNALQDNVRDILADRHALGESSWPDTLVRSREHVSESNLRHVSRPLLSRKRLCSVEAANGYRTAIPRSVSFTGPGMWDGILN